MSKKFNQIQNKAEESSTLTSKVFPLAQANNFLFTSSSKSPSATYTKINREKVDTSKNSSRTKYTNFQKNVKTEQNSSKSSQISTYNQNRQTRMADKNERNPKILQEYSFQASQNIKHNKYFSDIPISRNTEQEKKKHT